LSVGLTTRPCKKLLFRNRTTSSIGLDWEKTENWISELICGTWNIRTLYKPGATGISRRDREIYNEMRGTTRGEIGRGGYNKDITNNNHKWKK